MAGRCISLTSRNTLSELKVHREFDGRVEITDGDLAMKFAPAEWCRLVAALAHDPDNPQTLVNVTRTHMGRGG
jgi:hypothetical protein